MDVLLSAAFDNAVVVSLLAVVVLIVDRVARRPAFSHWLWVLLLVKLVTPPLGDLPLSLPEVFRPARPSFPVNRPAIRPDTAPPSVAATVPVEPPGQMTEPRAPGLADRAKSLAQEVTVQVALESSLVVSVVWLVSSGLVLGWILLRLARIRDRLRDIPLAPLDVQEQARQVARKLGLGHCPGVWFVSQAIAPALWAVGRQPRLLIPSDLWDRLDESQRASLLAHELAHWKRGDHWVVKLELVVTAVFWWFPVVWWIRRSLHEAEEQCCDAWVVWALPGAERAYARTLLDTVDFLAEASPPPLLGASGIGSTATIKARLSRIMRGVSPRQLSWASSAVVVGLAGILVALAPYHAPARGFRRGYRIIDLGSSIRPTAINNRGQVVGNSTGAPNHAFLWDRGQWMCLSGSRGISAVAIDINDQGQVTGWFWGSNDPGPIRTLEGPSPSHAYRTAPNGPIDPDTDNLDTRQGRVSLGYAINNLGQVAGTAELPGTTEPLLMTIRPRGRSDGTAAPSADNSIPVATPRPRPARTHAFRTAPNQPINPTADDLDALGNVSDHPVAINDEGEVVGQMLVYFGDGKAFSLRGHRTPAGRPIDPARDDLNPATFPDGAVNVTAINNRGQVVGEAQRKRGDRLRRAFRTAPHQPIHWETDELLNLSSPRAINNEGIVLGVAPRHGSYQFANWAVHDGTAIFPLNTLIPAGCGWLIISAADINDRGQIIGEAYNPMGELHAYLLEPMPDTSRLYWLLGGVVLTGLLQLAGRIERWN